MKVIEATQVRAQYWIVILPCQHQQEVHSVRPDGPLYVRGCHECAEATKKNHGTDTLT